MYISKPAKMDNHVKILHRYTKIAPRICDFPELIFI